MKRDIIYTENKFLRIFLSILSLIFYVLHKIKFSLYKFDILPKIRLKKAKVVSVGNITAGGTGKTPLTIHLAKKLSEKGKKVAILFRAYKSKKKNGLVYDGNKFFMNIEECGDEPYMIAKETGAVVYIGKYRAKTALEIENTFDVDIILLDDGFQYWRLIRDIDIVCVDTVEYFYNLKMLPAGILREPIKNLERADFVILKNDGRFISDKKRVIDYFDDEECILSMNYSYENNKELEEKENILLIAGIAKPGSFFKNVKNLLGEKQYYCIDFEDHVNYDEEKIDYIKEYMKRNNIQSVVCTQKDFYKIKDRIENLFFIKLYTTLENEEKIIEKIINMSNSR